MLSSLQALRICTALYWKGFFTVVFGYYGGGHWPFDDKTSNRLTGRNQDRVWGGANPLNMPKVDLLDAFGCIFTLHNKTCMVRIYGFGLDSRNQFNKNLKSILKSKSALSNLS